MQSNPNVDNREVIKSNNNTPLTLSPQLRRRLIKFTHDSRASRVSLTFT